MRHAVAATLLGFSLATPAMAQAPNIQQLLGGLLTGNQNQDQALRDAFERGYQRGRADEARVRADRGDRAGRRDQGERDNGYREDRGRDQSYGRPGYRSDDNR